MAGGEGGEAAAPLLEKEPQAYFDGCPGCAMELRKAENPGIPYRLFFHIWIINFVSSLPISLLFPFMYFMIRDLHITTREEDIGFYAGFVGASYMLGRALSSIVWGMVADRIRRKPVIVLGIFAVLVFNTLFGLSLHYWMALITRFLLGSLNGLCGPIRAYAIEVCRVEHQAIGLSLETLHKHKCDDKEEQAARYCIARLADVEESIKQHSSSTKNKNLFKNWPLMSSIILYCIISFDDSAYSEIFPLWAESDKKFGGLNFSTEDVGQVLVVAGVSMLLYQTFIYPHILKAQGPINASRIATITVYTNSMILQNNYVSQDQRATAVGLSITLMSFSKAMSPTAAGIVFSWAQRRQDAFFFPGDQMVFFLLGVVVLTEFIWTFRPFLATPEQISSC